MEQFKQNPKLHLVLTDLSMPGMDGFQLCRAIRELTLQQSGVDTSTTATTGDAHFAPRFPVVIAVSGAAETNTPSLCQQVCG